MRETSASNSIRGRASIRVVPNLDRSGESRAALPLRPAQSELGICRRLVESPNDFNCAPCLGQPHIYRPWLPVCEAPYLLLAFRRQQIKRWPRELDPIAHHDGSQAHNRPNALGVPVVTRPRKICGCWKEAMEWLCIRTCSLRRLKQKARPLPKDRSHPSR